MTQNVSDQRPTLKTSPWDHTSAPGPELETLHRDKKSDIVIIGASAAGLSTALHLAEAGCSVAVLEARKRGSRATGKSGGLITPDFIDHDLDQIESKFGEEWGGRLIKLVGSAAGQCFDLISAHNISCDAKQDGFWTPAHNEATAGKLRKRTTEWQDRGYEVEYFEQERTDRNIGSTATNSWALCGQMPSLFFADADVSTKQEPENMTVFSIIALSALLLMSGHGSDGTPEATAVSGEYELDLGPQVKDKNREIVLRKIVSKYPARDVISWAEKNPVPGETAAYWERVQRVDGARAWSSPIYVQH